MVPQYDYSKLRGLIKEHYDTLGNFSRALGISQTSLNDRLQNRIVFGQDEIERSIELLKINPSEDWETKRRNVSGYLIDLIEY